MVMAFRRKELMKKHFYCYWQQSHYKEYVSTYTKEGDKPWVLQQIEHIENQRE